MDKGKRTNDKQKSTKHYTVNWRCETLTPIKSGGEVGCSEWVRSPCSTIVAAVNYTSFQSFDSERT